MMKNESNRTLKQRGESEIMLEPDIERNHALVLLCLAFQNIKFLAYQIDISHFVRQRHFQRSLEKSTNKKYQKHIYFFLIKKHLAFKVFKRHPTRFQPFSKRTLGMVSAISQNTDSSQLNDSAS